MKTIHYLLVAFLLFVISLVMMGKPATVNIEKAQAEQVRGYIESLTEIEHSLNSNLEAKYEDMTDKQIELIAEKIESINSLMEKLESKILLASDIKDMINMYDTYKEEEERQEAEWKSFNNELKKEGIVLQ